eukprot:1117569-Rhodomonas_salina.2
MRPDVSTPPDTAGTTRHARGRTRNTRGKQRHTRGQTRNTRVRWRNTRGQERTQGTHLSTPPALLRVGLGEDDGEEGRLQRVSLLT